MQRTAAMVSVDVPVQFTRALNLRWREQKELTSGAFSRALVNPSNLAFSSKSAWRTPRHPTAAPHDADNCQTGTRPFPSVEAPGSHQIFDGIDASQSRYSVSLSSSMVSPCSRQNVVNASKGNTSAEGFSSSAMITLKSTGMKVCLASTDSAAKRPSCAKQSLNAKPQPNKTNKKKTIRVGLLLASIETLLQVWLISSNSAIRTALAFRFFCGVEARGDTVKLASFDCFYRGVEARGDTFSSASWDGLARKYANMLTNILPQVWLMSSNSAMKTRTILCIRFIKHAQASKGVDRNVATFCWRRRAATNFLVRKSMQ